CTSGTGTIAVTSGNGGPKQDVLVTYTPPTNNPASGSATTLNDSCEYTIGNGTQPDDTANILVAVTNSVPNAVDGNASAISTQGNAPAGRTATFTSPGTGGSLGNAGVTTAGNGTKGTTSVAGNVITYTVTDAAFFAGSDTFTYTVTDADGDASDEVDTGTVTVTIADVSPVIADGAITTDADTASTALAPTITAGNGSAAQHTLAVTTNGTHGSCALSAANATGTVTYTPDAGYTGADSCVLTLTDGDGDTDTATISVTVSAVGGGTGSGVSLPGGGAVDPWSLSLLAGLLLLRRKRLAWPGNPGTADRGQG
ncbi:MAG: GlyGly-CTERM sorting domain-containing protein, partial [Gammaproteobacteria bacterium]|nr:GlyGly-CTERM sorting domain-containing protein [Gammaproteobacteria bacterium]